MMASELSALNFNKKLRMINVVYVEDIIHSKTKQNWNLYALTPSHGFKTYKPLRMIEPTIAVSSIHQELFQSSLKESHGQIIEEKEILKSKKIGTLLLISIVSICAIMTAMILPTPWNFMVIGFGGPITTLIKRLFKK